jgi:DNA-directed RNA polymerase subunit M/transcription elongation factor TFIIS
LIEVAPNCETCGEDLHVNAVERPNVDWVKVVCSNCGNVENISMIRLDSNLKNKANNE